MADLQAQELGFDCPSCEGSGIVRCTTPWCTDSSHDGECNKCGGSGLLTELPSPAADQGK
jgi:predicted RNA-binding Zn-ribbon protein involved in translation (DUF1610 family)